MRVVLFLFLLILTLSLAHAFPIGVVRAEPVCVRPNSTGSIGFLSQSMSNSSEYFNVYIIGMDWVTIEGSNYVLIQPHSEIMINAMINTANVSEGFYNGTYNFCYLPTVSNATAVVPCIKSDFGVNVSQACPETNKTLPKTTSLADNKQNYSYLSIPLSGAFLAVVLIFIVRRFLIKRRK
jgi:hypothetical protein